MKRAEGGTVNEPRRPFPIETPQYRYEWNPQFVENGPNAVQRSMAAVEKSKTLLDEFREGKKRALENVREAYVAFERAKHYNVILSQLVASDLYEEADGQVRQALNGSERIEMRNKLLNAGHEIGYTKEVIEIVQTDPLYRYGI